MQYVDISVGEETRLKACQFSRSLGKYVFEFGTSKILSRVGMTLDVGLDWRIDLLTTYRS
jgi:hypothetical protein